MEFKLIPSLNNLYEINENGTMLRRLKDGCLVRPFLVKGKYLQVLIRDKQLIDHPRAHTQLDGRVQVHCKIHQLVAEVFIGTKPSGMVIDHIDRDARNNHYTNLRYATISENWHNTSLEIRQKMKAVSQENVQRMLEHPNYNKRKFFRGKRPQRGVI